MTGVVTLLTDFGAGSIYVGQMQAVLARLAPSARVIDLAHDVPFADVEAGAYLLGQAFPHCPDGSVHVVVVDPGVGGDRAVLAVASHGHRFVGPDNGVLEPVLDGAVVHAVERPDLVAERVSPTFHGRDIMAPIAARLLGGTSLEEVGPAVEPRRGPQAPVPHEGRLEGRVLAVDRFGNLVTNLTAAALYDLGVRPETVTVTVGGHELQGLARTFGDVAPGTALAYVGSGGRLEVAVNRGRASDVLDVGTGTHIVVRGEPR